MSTASARAPNDSPPFWIARRQTSFCLQETKCNPEQVPAELFTSRGYEWEAIGAGGRNGVLIASRIGLVAPTLGLPTAASGAVHAPQRETTQT